MKKELTAAVLLMLLICGAVFNILHVESFTKELSLGLSRSQAAVEDGDFDRALSTLDRCIERWEAEHAYANVFIRHPELDATFESFYQLQELLLQKDAEAAASAYSRLQYRLDCIAYMERPSLGSIF